MCSYRPKATHLQKSLCAHDSQLGADKRQVCIFASLESASIGQFDTTVLQVMNENVHIFAHESQLGADKHQVWYA